jgi:hypothetical protein
VILVLVDLPLTSVVVPVVRLLGCSVGCSCALRPELSAVWWVEVSWLVMRSGSVALFAYGHRGCCTPVLYSTSEPCRHDLRIRLRGGLLVMVVLAFVELPSISVVVHRCSPAWLLGWLLHTQCAASARALDLRSTCSAARSGHHRYGLAAAARGRGQRSVRLRYSTAMAGVAARRTWSLVRVRSAAVSDCCMDGDRRDQGVGRRNVRCALGTTELAWKGRLPEVNIDAHVRKLDQLD